MTVVESGADQLAKMADYPRIGDMHVNTTMIIRAGSLDDVEVIYQLNKQGFSEYWSRASLYSSLESGYDVLIAELHGESIAYLLSLSVLDEIQIMQIAVSEKHQRQGLASRMTDELIASAIDVQSITLEVRASNKPARACYTQLGFQEVGYRKHYYAPNASGYREDAVLMTKHLHGALIRS